MKKLLVVAVALTSVNAFATRARVNALANSPHLIDTQTVYSNPADMFYVGGDYVTLESGETTIDNGSTTTATDGRDTQNNAEGMIVRSWGDAKMGLALGHMSSLSYTLRDRAASLFSAAVNYHQQNPIELSYGMKAGDLAWAGTLVYSNFAEKDGNNEKESSMGVRFGMRMGALDAKVGLGLGNTYQNDLDGKFKGDIGITAGVGYALDQVYVSGKFEMGGFKTEDNADNETSKVSGMMLGVYATSSQKKDGNEFFYGAGLENRDNKVTLDNLGAIDGDYKVGGLVLPVWMGLEVDAASWLTLRGSVKQNVLLTESKDDRSTAAGGLGDFSAGPNTTEVAAGVGLKFNKINLDGSIVSGGNQNLDGQNLISQVGLTYVF